MSKFYSKTTNGFYDDAIHESMPDDAVSITDEKWLYLLNEQSQGRTIQPDAGGLPETVAPPPPPDAVLWSQYQFQAKTLLNASDLTILRCYENSVAIPTDWSNYRKKLRAIVSATMGDHTLPLPSKPEYPAGT